MKKYFIILLLFSITAWSQNKAVLDSIVYYDNQGDFLKAISLSDREAKKLVLQKKYPAFCHIAIKEALLYTKLKDHSKGVQVLFNALKIIDKKAMPIEKVQLTKIIADIYYQAMNVQKSIYYYNIANKNCKKIKNDTLLASVYQGCYKVYAEQRNPDSIKFYATEILKLTRVGGGYSRKAKSYNNMYSYYCSIQKPELAKKYLDTSVYYANLSKNRVAISSSYANLGYHYMVYDKDFKKAEKELLKISQLFKMDTLNMVVSDSYLNLSYVYEQLNDYKTANLYLNKYRVNTETIFNNQQNQQIQDVETRYKVQKNADEFEAKELRLKESQKKRQLFYIIAIVTLIGLLILIAVLFQLHKLKQKNKLNIIESNLKENLINATIDGQETERKNVATVLHDNVSALLSSAGLQLMAFSAAQPTKSEEIAKAKAIIKDAHDKVRDLSHQLVPTLLAKFGLIYALEDMCEKNSNSIITFNFSSNLNTKTRFEEDYEMKLYFIISEIINNVLKHSNAGHADVKINKENENLSVSVSDNGQGFEIAKDKSNEGFGITQIRARINNLKGKLAITSAKGKGTTVEIQVPIIEKPSTPIA